MTTTTTQTNKAYAIDTGAISFAVTNSVANQFRLVAHLEDEVNVELLQKAVDLSILRYPMFNVNYSKGKGCVAKVNTVSTPIKVQPYALQFKKIDIASSSPKLKVFYKNKAIAVEIYHTLTDANGGLQLLNTILACYQRLQGKIVDESGIIPYDSPINQEEYVDGYEVFAEKGKTQINTTPLNKPLKLRGEPLTKGINDSFVKMTFSGNDLQRVRENTKATIHEIFVTLMYLTYLELKSQYKSNKEIRIQMAINLRGKFDTATLRNFVASVQFSTAEKTFEGILSALKEFMALATSEKESKSFLYKGRTLIKRVLPLLPSFFGKFCVKIGENILGDSGYSTNLSNLGIVRNNLVGIRGYDFIISPPRRGVFCVSACGYKDNCNLIFSRRIDNDAFEKEFINQLNKVGLSPIRAEKLT